MKKLIAYSLGILSSIALMIILLISSIEILCYHIPGYFKYEYEKYKVYENVNMDIDELMNVSNQMMDYLRDKRENLHDISANINGKEDILFFNEREVAHMADVKALFLAAISIRMFLFAFIIISILSIYLLEKKIYSILGKSILIGATTFFSLSGVLAYIVSINFNKAFFKFHEIFFNNDLWLLDANTDRLINIVPEPFFIDTARNIAIIFFLFILLSFLLAFFMINKGKLKKA